MCRRLGPFVAVADALAQHAIQAAGHQRQLQIAVDLHRHGRRQRVHVEEVDAVRDGVFDDHALGVAADELEGRALQLIGQQQRRLLVTQIGDGDLTDRPGYPGRLIRRSMMRGVRY